VVKYKMKPRIGITMELSAKAERRLNFLDLAYAQAVEGAGGMPVYFPSLLSPGTFAEAISMIDGLILSGGADIHPSYYGEEITAPISLSPDQRTDFDLGVFRSAVSAGKVILAICHGMQIMNVALGGTLYQDITSQLPGSILHREMEAKNPARHSVQVEPGSKLADILGGILEFEVCSTHHQGVKDLGKGLRISAKSPDGLVEGVELPGYPKAIGIQWHPEKDPGSEASRRLLRALVQMASP
jgi:gamma-glutamyl-gamma-aminobutyrate hydrolase PuuD